METQKISTAILDLIGLTLMAQHENIQLLKAVILSTTDQESVEHKNEWNEKLERLEKIDEQLWSSFLHLSIEDPATHSSVDKRSRTIVPVYFY